MKQVIQLADKPTLDKILEILEQNNVKITFFMVEILKKKN